MLYACCVASAPVLRSSRAVPRRGQPALAGIGMKQVINVDIFAGASRHIMYIYIYIYIYIEREREKYIERDIEISMFNI